MFICDLSQLRYHITGAHNYIPEFPWSTSDSLTTSPGGWSPCVKPRLRTTDRDRDEACTTNSVRVAVDQPANCERETCEMYMYSQGVSALVSFIQPLEHYSNSHTTTVNVMSHIPGATPTFLGGSNPSPTSSSLSSPLPFLPLSFPSSPSSPLRSRLLKDS